MAKREVEEYGGGLIGKMIAVNRAARVVKDGRIMAFSTLTIVGDSGDRIGMGKGKPGKVPVVVQKTIDQARRSMIKVPLKNGAIHHEVIGHHGATRVFMQPAKEGNGIKAGGLMRLVFDAMGIHNISVKVYDSTSPYNIVCATLDGLSKLYTPADIVAKRGLIIEDILGTNHD